MMNLLSKIQPSRSIVPTKRLFAAGATLCLGSSTVTAFSRSTPVPRTVATSQLGPSAFTTVGSQRFMATVNADPVSLANEKVRLEEDSMQKWAPSVLRQHATNYDISWNTDARLDSAIEVASKAFAGNKNTNPEPVFDWVLRDIIGDLDMDDPERKAVFDFLLDMLVKDSLKLDTLVFGHDMTGSIEENNGIDQDILGSVAVIENFDPSKSSSFFQTVQNEMSNLGQLGLAAIRGQLPSAISKPSNFVSLMRQMLVLQNLFKKAHIEYGPQEKHLYVRVVGMDPDFQGMGFGKQMMTAINDLADSRNQPAYLECAGDKNPRFYEKFGYKIVHEQKLDGDDGSKCSVFLMVRESNQ